MSYIIRETDGLPAIPSINSARRIKELEAELRAFRQAETRSTTPTLLNYNGSQTRRAVHELQDQVKSLREEVKKKDGLVQHLVSLDSAPKVIRTSDSYRVDPLYLAEKTTLEATRQELATVLVKYEKVVEKVKELEVEVESRDIRMRELEHRVGSSNETETRLSEVIAALKDKLAGFESRADQFETVANRGELTIATLQKENRDLHEKLVSVEARLRKQLEDKEAIENRLHSESHRLGDLLTHLSGILYTEEVIDVSQGSVDHIIKKLTDIVQENALLKGKIVTMNEHLTETQLETKAGRETIMRLVSEVSREQKMTTRFTSDVESLRLDRDNAIAARQDLEREVVLLRERLDAGQRTIEATKSELELVTKRFGSMERNFRDSHIVVQTSETEFSLFREQIANLLKIAFDDVVPTEQCIKDCVGKISKDKRELDKTIENLEDRFKAANSQLEKELAMHREIDQRSKRIEVENADLMERLRIAEGELASGDVLREGFKFDKEKYLRGLQKLGEIMKMDRISLDLGLDLTMDALLARAEQLVHHEVGTVAEKSSHVYSLQRKLKALKEQLESKDLHIDLLRKKMTSLEERAHGRIDAERLRETESLRVQKLEKLVEKYKLQLQDSRQEVQNLKAQLMGSGELKVRTLEQRKDIEELVKQVEELEEVRRRQSHKISELKETVDISEASTHERTVASENAVQALSSELRTTKNSLESMKQKEKQLLDFRTVVSRMLGLDINTLAVPDYEIISRLEKLIAAHHTTAFTTLSLEEALADVQDGTAAECRNILAGTDSVIVRSRERSRRKANKLRTRARSLSPMKRDPRQY